MALAFVFLLPWFAAAVVRHAIEADSAADRAAYAAGGSPWAWRFHDTDDVVAGRAFGGGRLEPGHDALTIRATDGSTFEIGLPLTRTVDLTRVGTLRLDATASAAGRYGLTVRETLDGPLVLASLGTLDPGSLDSPLALDRLAWRTGDGSPAAVPRRAAMLRLNAALPAGQALALRGATMLASSRPAQAAPGPFAAGNDSAPRPPATAPTKPATLPLPGHRSAEGLLAWRDDRRRNDPLVLFGEAMPGTPLPAWSPWLATGLYVSALAMLAWRRRVRPSSSLLDVVAVVGGPIGFIAGLGLAPSPSLPGIVAFLAGVLYGAGLTLCRDVPDWRWLGAWRAAGWPLLAIPVAMALVALFGHALAWPSVGRMLLYVGWACFQQWLMLAVAGALLDRVLPRPVAVLLTALAFALLHTPNGLLMQLCFVAELGWAWWYLHRRALLPVAIAHAASAVILQAGLAGGVLRSLEVSARFLT